LVGCAAALSELVACDSPPKADDSNFEKTLQGYYDSHPVCAEIPLTFPVGLRSDGDAARKQQLEPLVAAGLIAVTTIQKDEPAAPGQGQATDYLRYAPNAAGEKVVRKGRGQLSRRYGHLLRPAEGGQDRSLHRARRRYRGEGLARHI
jgi:hypothetical protein